LALAAAAGFCPAVGAGVVVDGIEWRQLTETLNFTWNEVAAACPQDGTTPCSGVITRASDGTSVDVGGWTWARNSEVRALFEKLIQPEVVNFASDFSSFGQNDDPDIHRVLSEPGWFEPTIKQPAYDDFYRFLHGWSATTYGSNNAYVPTLTDLTTGQGDSAGLGSTNPRTIRLYLSTYPMGVWLYRPAGVTLSDLTLSSPVVAGSCKSVTAVVTLSEPAPAGGVVVGISDTLTSATPTRATIAIAAGVATGKATIKTAAVNVQESGTVSASLGAKTLARDLTVRPIGLSSIALKPSTVVGSNPVVGTATLECVAAPGAVTVDLSSNDAAIATPVAASIVVPQTVKAASFDVTTSPVQAPQKVTITGAANGITKSKVLTVNPAAELLPKLVYFSQAIGTTSLEAVTTLANKGAVPFSVNGITLSGSGLNATYYTYRTDCDATLAGGATCTIWIKFKPMVVGYKPATLSVATSAASEPLKVSLRGTGVMP
jgi:hypothetical protein